MFVHSVALLRTESTIDNRNTGSTSSVTQRVSHHLCPHRITKPPVFRMFGCWILIVAAVVACFCMPPGFSAISTVAARQAWEKPGCHKVGHSRVISIPGCVEFNMKTNACRGYCESWAIPSGPKANPQQPVTSIGQCCNMMDTEDVEARVLCVDGIKTLTFKSATNCACYHCKKD